MARQKILPVASKQLQHRSHGSTAIANLEYDEESQEVTCEFQERGTYTYFDVPPDEFANWNTANSRGTYFNLYIRGIYSYERIS